MGTSPLKNITYAVAGTTLEWYDLSLFGLLITFFPTIFFPSLPREKAQIILMVSYLCSYLCKFIGGNRMAALADRYGRKSIFINSSLLMTASTLLMACFPIHFLSPLPTIILFFLIRILSGISSGVETTGALVFSYEHAKKTYKIFSILIVYASINIGYLLADTVCDTLIAHVSTDELTAYAWRIPYIISSLIGIGALWCRYQITETPEFNANSNSKDANQRNLIKPYLPAIIACIGIYFLVCSLDQFFEVSNFYFIDFFQYSLHTIYRANLAITLMTFGAIALCQFLLYQFSVRAVLTWLTIAIALFSAPSFWLLKTHTTWAYSLVYFLSDAPEPLVFMTITYFICQHCHTHSRTTALTLIENTCSCVGAAFPLLLNILLHKSNDPYLLPKMIWIGSAVMIVAIYLLFWRKANEFHSI